MLESITNLSFAQFGHVEYSGFDAAAGRLGCRLISQRQLTDKKLERLFINPQAPTVLDIQSGTAVIYVGASPEALQAFLLDKAIVLLPGIYFCVVPLIHTATISVAKGEGLTVTPVKLSLGSTDITSELAVGNIHTLFYHEKERGFSFKGECHDFWELTYVDKGVMYNQLEEKPYKLSQGDLMIFPPDMHHSQYADEGMAVCYITLTFEMDYPEPGLFAETIFKADGEVKTLLKKLLLEKENPMIYSQDMILAYLKEILVGLIRSKKLESILSRADAAVTQTVENDIIQQAKRYIHENIRRGPAVSMTAKSIPVSPGYLSTIFKKYTGQTVVEYIRKEKLACAKDFLRLGTYSITQIAQMLSFSSVHYFSKQFKSQFGISPSEYGAALKKE